MKRYLLLLTACIVAYLCSNCQAIAQSVTITPGNGQPSIEANSTDNGVLISKVTLTNNLNSASPVNNPAAGLLIYNTGGNQVKGFYYWTGTAWQLLGNGTPLNATAPIVIESNTVKLNAGTQAGQLLTWDGNNWVNTNPNPYPNVQLNNLQPYLAINFSIALQGIYPSQNADEPFLGEIAMYGFSFPPKGWALCNGQLLSIEQNDPLYQLLGTTYGGNGISTFGLPDLRSRVPIHKGQGPGLSNYTLGQTGGVEMHSFSNKY
ncbi:tail fiber protein [Emticicia agri]|uniref:Phage tail collar domain-containing protein n=1 Tax=Emticicia agri TaxID=2492393 RepID=A0A4V1ZDE1_9BACT|nr:tail fiber protein [Emticicia agri]RYU95840.1 hypothetical protein EWM59_09445 [Emticicia agri]